MILFIGMSKEHILGIWKRPTDLCLSMTEKSSCLQKGHVCQKILKRMGNRSLLS